MSEYIETAKQYISEGNEEEALKLARKRHGKDDAESYIAILDLLIENGNLAALEEKGMYYQYYDPTHDDGDYGEKYFDEYLSKQPRSINVLCDKAMSKFNKGNIDESLEYMDKAVDKYKSYSSIEKPRLSKKELIMARIELLIQAKRYEEALKSIKQYESQFGSDQKTDLYMGQMLQKNGKNREALEYLDKSLLQEDTLVAFNAKGDALYELKEYKEALKCYKNCIQYEGKVEDDLELVTNFNYKAAFCCVNLNDDEEAVKYLNKTINMLNEHGRLPNDIEKIYQKCSFEKERIMKTGKVEDKEFKRTKFFSARSSIIILLIIVILYVILKMKGYG
ncbi:tetratricopeptide repeat protein [Methanobrevibacter thaueri]|uniref:Tetratricopeptide repeat protein n=1 Tax=Methanobrevibacter thaueri TaxID=190975 RepID=A0A315XQ65_9EURY|nr:tetratricopeptide repeat protein [Methanobrevibacter thaueri]PWB88153.1 tetratricopeptide repeat protein [Methanobrevibacter thaueri]